MGRGIAEVTDFEIYGSPVYLRNGYR